MTAAVSVVGGREPTESRTWLVDPGIEIPGEATAVHGITTEKAQSESLDAATSVTEITLFLAEQVAEDIPIIAFNARFDLSILCEDYGIPLTNAHAAGADALAAARLA